MQPHAWLTHLIDWQGSEKAAQYWHVNSVHPSVKLGCLTLSGTTHELHCVVLCIKEQTHTSRKPQLIMGYVKIRFKA